MADKDLLKDMVDSIVADNNEQAQVHFHEYMRDKVREQLGTNTDTTDED